MATSISSRGPLGRVFRGLAKPLIPPALFDFWAAKLNPLWSWDRPLARVVARHRIAPDAVSLELVCNRHCGPVLPGQHVNIGVEIDGRCLTRSYSPQQGPGRRLTISIKTIEGGRVSRHLCENTRVGDILQIGRAFGEMLLPDMPTGSWLFLAAGSGITPLASQIRALAAAGMPVEAHLCYWARSESELWFADEFRALAKEHPRFHAHLFVTRESPTAKDVRQDRLDASLLESVCGALPGRHVHACGPVGFVDAARAALPDDVARFRKESFSPPAWRASDAAGEVNVHLVKRKQTLALPRSASLLSALESAGLRLKSGCRMGICHSCVCAKTSGTTEDLLTGDIASEPTRALRLCVSRPASDLVLDL